MATSRTLSTDATSPIDAAGAFRLRPPTSHLALSTPVVDDHVVLSSQQRESFDDVLVEMLADDRVLAQTEVDLPGGASELRLSGASGDTLRVTLPNPDGEPVVLTFPLVPLEP